MDWLMNGSTLLLALVGTLVGARLLRLAAKEHGLPELAIGLALTCYSAMAQGGRLLSLALGQDAAPELLIAATTYRVVGYAVTLGGLAVFTWRVFGTSSQWRQALAGLVTGVATVCSISIVRSAWIASTGGPPAPNQARVLLSAAFLVAFLWTSIEALRYYGLMRRRGALGLADPAITNRFLIWGAGAATSTALTVVPVAISMTGQVDSPLSIFATTAAGLLNALVWWLSFMPPAAYLRWVRSRGSEPCDAR